jgi:hypothetical protein
MTMASPGPITVNPRTENSGRKSQTLAGYMHPGYAESLAEFGTPCELSRCRGWILERQIPGFPYRDAMGCYPLFACQDWSQLGADLEDIGYDLVSLALVTDPFGAYKLAYLHWCFDVVIPFKQHFIVDLSHPPNTFVSHHHQRYARRALENVQVERCQDPIQFVDEWINLYATLIERHNIKGLARFSRLAFGKQLKIPGIVVFRALCKETTVGMTLWYIQREVGYYHLGAYSTTGYKLRASFALFWFAIEYFAGNGLRLLNLGASPGVKDGNADGLCRFKRGWSTGTRTAYFCGRIFNHERYAEIVKAKGISATDYFPAYRQGEFV